MFIYLYMQYITSFKLETFSSLCEMSSSNPPSFLPSHHLPLFLYVFSFHLEIYLPNSWSFILVCIHFDLIFDFFVECHTTSSVYFAHTRKQSLPLLHLQNLPTSLFRLYLLRSITTIKTDQVTFHFYTCCKRSLDVSDVFPHNWHAPKCKLRHLESDEFNTLSHGKLLY